MVGARSVMAALAATVLSVGLCAGTAPAATPAIEINSQNPVTAQPPVSRPPTPACTVTLADAFPSNTASGAPQNFAGTLTPPAGCRGPWAKVVLDWTTSVRGRQYDRSGSLNVGSTQIWFGTTYEPDPAGITYHFAKDVTGYSALFTRPQPFSGGIGNYTSSVYTGVYLQTVTLTFYTSDHAHPAPAEPDAVVGLGGQDANATTPTVHLAAAGLPRNIVRAELEISIKGNGCDEQWFTAVPDDVAAKYPPAGLCGHGPYREVGAAIDGTAAGVVQYFPFIYTGGIVPTLWRPIPAIGTFDMAPEVLDVTPFVGRLVDGGSHDIALTVANAGDTWNLAANLLLYTDRGAATTSGALTVDTVAPATTHTTESTGTDGSTTAAVTAVRDWTTGGYVDTSAGRVRTTVTQQVAYANTDTVSGGGFVQHVRQTDTGSTTSASTGGHDGPTARTHSWSWPITITEDAHVVDDNDFTLSGSVDMTRQVADTELGAGRHVVTAFTDRLSSTASYQRTAGVVTAADGSEWENYAGSGGTGGPGGWYEHYLAAAHGYVTADHVSTHR